MPAFTPLIPAIAADLAGTAPSWRPEAFDTWGFPLQDPVLGRVGPTGTPSWPLNGRHPADHPFAYLVALDQDAIRTLRPLVEQGVVSLHPLPGFTPEEVEGFLARALRYASIEPWVSLLAARRPRQ